MTRRACEVLGTKLPDNHSCGDPCDDFPFCLSPLPAATRLQLATMLAETAATRDDLAATAEFLETLDAAITKGLERKGIEHAP